MSDVLAYIVNSAAWSSFGFCAGWVACKAARDVHDIRDEAVSDDDDD